MDNILIVLVVAVFAGLLHGLDGHALKQPLQGSPNRGGHVPRIMGGQNAKEGQFPFVTAVTIDDSFYCTSSLLSHNWIVTAAHCTEDVSTYGLKLGITNFNGHEDGVVTTTSRKIVRNPHYNTVNSSFDIALIMLASPVTYTSKIQPVKLPSRSMVSNSLAGTAVRDIGWGYSNAYPNDVSPILNYVDIKVLSNEECNKFYPGTMDSSLLCAYAKGDKGSCYGDSGGPLVMDYTSSPVLVGMTDFGPEKCTDGLPTGFARITHHLDWIHSTTGIAIHN
ncbi:brachyurin-like [Bacillus rossius redtenbacheri]|uniref:brachyurin-like n=1 Tax=Bacillus rossius redtenbacheri TaxID=93214 RepID=UPI002FDF03D2